jgi:glycolate oxidase FAD binding subunit
LASTLSELYAHGKAVVPFGGGTRIAVGNLPRRYDVALDLTGINSNIEHVAGDMTIVCDAGVQISELSNLLAEANQRLPFEVAHPNEATIGGSVASNAPSLLRPRFGGIRDWIIGLDVVLADGTRTKSGGRVVKNVQGYDLHRLHTGAFGTLGVIASVALKLVPLPERTRTVAMWFDRRGTASTAVSEIGQLELMMESARLYSGARAAGAIRELAAGRHMDAADAENAEFLMLAKVSGSNSALNRQIDELTGLAGTIPATGYESLAGTAETDLWEYLEVADGNFELSLQVAAKASDSIQLAHRLRDRLYRNQIRAEISTATDVGYGSLMFNVDVVNDSDAITIVDEAMKLVRDIAGSLLIERCPISVKKYVDVFCIDASSAQIMKNMKHQFDPEGILNPGRFAFKI